MLGMSAMSSFGQARAYSSDSKDDDIPDLGLGFQSLGSLFPPPPAPGRYSQPRERRAEEAKSTVREENASRDVSQQEVTPPPVYGRYSQPRDKKAEGEVTEKETMPPAKAPFFGSVASEQQSNATEQAGEPTSGVFTVKKHVVGNDYRDHNFKEVKWKPRLSENPHANDLARQEAGSLPVKQQDYVETSSSPRLRRERRVALTTKQPREARADTVVRRNNRRPAPNPVASKGPKVPPPAEPQPGKDAWGLSKGDQTTTYSPTPAEPTSSSTADKEASKTTTTTASPASRQLTHVRPTGEAHMVDVGAKPATKRTAIAIAYIRIRPEVYKQIEENSNKKGDVLGIARIAGIMAAKRTSDIIPLCHPLALTKAEVDVYLVPANHLSAIWPKAGHGRLVAIQTLVETVGPTGVEMEALMAAQGAALTVFDMCKALDKTMTIEGAKVVYKAGGRSGVSLDIKWKNDVGAEKFGPQGLREGLGNGDLLVKGRLNEKIPGVSAGTST
jgi:molybdenum cofactor biosynthesis protein MoaC